MYDRIDLKDNYNYFLKFEQRPSNGVYFFRYIGYSDSLLPFLKKYEETTKLNGLYISSAPLPNPNDLLVREFFSRVGTPENYDTSHVSKDITNYIPVLNQTQKVLLTDAICEMLTSLSANGMSENIIHNSYIKFMCWANNYFLKALKNIGKNEPPKILYEGTIGKYDVYMLRILSRAGCDILYFNTDDDNSYIKWDQKNMYSKPIYGSKKGAMLIHFSKLDPPDKVVQNHTCTTNTVIQNNTVPQNNINRNINITRNQASTNSKVSNNNNISIINTANNTINTNKWITDSDDLFEILFKTNNMRGLTPLSSVIYNIYAAYLGLDVKEEYNNRLCTLKENLKKQNKPFIIIENLMPNPSPDEVSKLKRFQPITKNDTLESLAGQITLLNDTKTSSILQQAFIEAMQLDEYATLSKLYNEGNKQICWIFRYISSLFTSFDKNTLPCVIFFGTCKNKSEMLFINMLSKMPLDIIIIDPTNTTAYLTENCLKISLPTTSDEFDKYPDSKLRVRVATTAYSAERELDTVLYSGTGLYRQHQFLYSKPVTLKTTFEEIDLLWKEEAKYRPAFEIQDNNEVILPNIFAKVCGIKDNDIASYIKYVRSLIDENTITINKFPYLSCVGNPFTHFIKGFHNKNEVAVDFIKKHQSYKFDYLSENIQETIFSKMQELINLDWIHADGRINVTEVIIGTILNLDKKTLQLIQQFDFTKKVPKLILVSTDESMFSLEDCIYICFLNLIGFDIIIFTPTGYRNIEKFVNPAVFEQYIIGDYKYDLNSFELKALTIDTNNNIFKKFFKGR